MIDALVSGLDYVRDLSDGWEYASLKPGSATHPSALATMSIEWQSAIVPGTVAGAEKVARNFLYGKTNYDIHDYWYRCRVILPEGARINLQFDGLATIAEVFWNDHHILSSTNMFLPQTIDATSFTKEGTLWIRFCSVDEALKAKRPRPKWRTRLVDNQQLRWIRRTLLGRIPTWSPPVAPVGPWRGVKIIANQHVGFDLIESKQTYDDKSGNITFSLRLNLTGFDKSKIDGLCLQLDERSIPLIVNEVTESKLEATLSTTIEPRDFWWPHTHGEPKLCKVSVTYSIGGEPHQVDLGYTGFRHIEVDQSQGNFRLSVNGTVIFCRGACWTPIDPVNYGCDTNQVAELLGSIRSAGMNMLRLVGSMVYETSDFYRLCDRLGILVWQDFMFSNLDYPFSDDSFRTGVRAEIESFLRKTQLNPSIAILCGNSDIEQQTAMLGLPPHMWRPAFFADELPTLVRELRPDATYVPSSPTGGDLPFEADTSISHYYGVGAYLRPLSDARLAEVKFAAECLGFANVPETSTIFEWLKNGETPPTHPRWKERVPRDGGASWDFDDVRDHYLQLLFGVDPLKLRYSYLEQYMVMSRITSGEVMLRTIQEWRRVGSSCSGAIIWWLKDLWLGPGWGVIDADCKPKAAYYFLSRAMAPTTLFFTDEGLNGLDIHAINESQHEIAGNVEIEFLNSSCISVGRYSASLVCEPHSSRKFRIAALTEHFNDSSYAYRFGPPAHSVVRARWIAMGSNKVVAESFHFPAGYNLPKEPDLQLTYTLRKVDDRNWQLHLTANKFIQYLHLEMLDCTVSDNYFHLFPASSRTVDIKLNRDQPCPEGHLSALNSLTQITLRPTA